MRWGRGLTGSSVGRFPNDWWWTALIMWLDRPVTDTRSQVNKASRDKEAHTGHPMASGLPLGAVIARPGGKPGGKMV